MEKKSMKRISVIAFLWILLILTAVMCPKNTPKYHYETRRDLSIYFTNSDSVIEAIRNGLRRRDERITVSYRSHNDNMADINALISELMDCAFSETDDPREGDYIYHQYGGYELQYSYTCKSDLYEYEIVILPNYYTDAEKEEWVSEKISEILGTFSFDENTSDYEKVKAVYDYVYENVDYDKVHKDNESNHLKTTAYSALRYGQAVCQGYSVLMYRLLRESGVDCRIITGDAYNDEGKIFHAWNIVCIDGQYYDLDATWDKQLETHEYFLKSDSNFTDHIRDEKYSTEEFYKNYPMSENDYNGGNYYEKD
jgi:transglutaminase-like putative cysteine protease